MPFWMKCNKLLKNDSGKLIQCTNCPCGYYAIFGIKFRDIDYKTLQPSSECSWYYNVQAYHVVDNKIQWNYMGSMCIPVDRQIGYCGTNKGCVDCWDECVEYDEETWECKKYEEYCYGCYEAKVYNISGCFDNYQDFAEYFYSGCGVEPSESGTYPDIWYTSYGYEYMTDSANSCVENHWNKVFTDKYMLNYSLQYMSMYQKWWQSAAWANYYYGDYHCFCWGDNCDYEEISCDTECPEGCTKESYPYDQHQVSVDGYAYMENNDSVYIQVHGAGWYGTDSKYCKDSPCYHETCCDRNDAHSTVSETGAFMMGHLRNKDSYIQTGTSTTNCENSGSLCTSFSYKSAPFDNYYGDSEGVRYNFNWYKLKLNRNSNTPSDATGVKFSLYMKRTKKNEGYGRGTSEVTESTQEISINFGEEYTDLPFADHINTMTFIKGFTCKTNESGECEYDYDASDSDCKNQPHVTFWYQDQYENDVLTDEYEIKLTAIEYIRSGE